VLAVASTTETRATIQFSFRAATTCWSCLIFYHSLPSWNCTIIIILIQLFFPMQHTLMLLLSLLRENCE
jgi:hypothetical protein